MWNMSIPGRGNPGTGRAGDLPCVLEEQRGSQCGYNRVSDEESWDCSVFEGRRRERKDRKL